MLRPRPSAYEPAHRAGTVGIGLLLDRSPAKHTKATARGCRDHPRTLKRVPVDALLDIRRDSQSGQTSSPSLAEKILKARVAGRYLWIGAGQCKYLGFCQDVCETLINLTEGGVKVCANQVPGELIIS